mmetsp:Transcript_119752/g.344120  ORF Transcript_119752/g.344120 Transcript_119752/m.344120 type:complete len:371 (+) Transcript_119752:743-1855(+)
MSLLSSLWLMNNTSGILMLFSTRPAWSINAVSTLRILERAICEINVEYFLCSMALINACSCAKRVISFFFAFLTVTCISAWLPGPMAASMTIPSPVASMPLPASNGPKAWATTQRCRTSLDTKLTNSGPRPPRAPAAAKEFERDGALGFTCTPKGIGGESDTRSTPTTALALRSSTASVLPSVNTSGRPVEPRWSSPWASSKTTEVPGTWEVTLSRKCARAATLPPRPRAPVEAHLERMDGKRKPPSLAAMEDFPAEREGELGPKAHESPLDAESSPTLAAGRSNVPSIPTESPSQSSETASHARTSSSTSSSAAMPQHAPALAERKDRVENSANDVLRALSGGNEAEAADVTDAEHIANGGMTPGLAST